MYANLKLLLNISMLLSSLLVLGCSPQESATEKNGPASEEANVADKIVGSVPNDAASKAAPMNSTMSGMGKMKFPDPKDMKFKDSIESNVDFPKAINELVFTNKDGTKIKLANYAGKKNVILVFTEGFNGMLCPFCKTQTSRLVANYDKFQERDCEVIVVYPGAEEHLDDFVEAALKTEKEQIDEVPFPIVLDKDFKATDFFDIHSMHAHPSTFLIDKQGNVKFAYVGADMTADRPSIKALLNRLDNLQ